MSETSWLPGCQYTCSGAAWLEIASSPKFQFQAWASPSGSSSPNCTLSGSAPATRVTLYSPASTYTCTGSKAVDVLPSPKFHCQNTACGLDRFWKTTVSGWTPEMGAAENWATTGWSLRAQDNSASNARSGVLGMACPPGL